MLRLTFRPALQPNSATPWTARQTFATQLPADEAPTRFTNQGVGGLACSYAISRMARQRACLCDNPFKGPLRTLPYGLGGAVLEALLVD